MNSTRISANNNSRAAGNDLYNKYTFGSPSFMEQYNITDLSSAMSSLLSGLKKKRKKLFDKIARAAILDGLAHFCFFGIGGCVLYVFVQSLTTQKTYYPINFFRSSYCNFIPAQTIKTCKSGRKNAGEKGGWHLSGTWKAPGGADRGTNQRKAVRASLG